VVNGLMSKNYETAFTAEDKAIILSFKTAIANLLKAATALEAVCNKYPKDYGRATDIETLVNGVRAAFSDIAVKLLEPK